MTAYQDTWFVGDNFLREAFPTLTNLRNHAGLNCRHPPYIYEFYNVFGYFQNRQSLVTGLTRLFNALMEALNNRLKLPKYVILVPDSDILEQMKVHFSEDSSACINAAVQWLITNINTCISRHEFDLFEKRPGALIAGSPKVIWIKMLKRPDTIIGKPNVSKTYGFRSKFNNILEVALA